MTFTQSSKKNQKVFIVGICNQVHHCVNAFFETQMHIRGLCTMKKNDMAVKGLIRGQEVQSMGHPKRQ